ncbi:hypothetical protein ACFQ0G_46845 [Streptomyces chiangmaiensis]
MTLSTIDLYERSFVLLGGHAGWRTAGEKVAARLDVPLDSYTIGEGAEFDLDTGDGPEWSSVHGTTAEGAVLVRPDGFVAWRAEGEPKDKEKELAEVLLQILGR